MGKNTKKKKVSTLAEDMVKAVSFLKDATGKNGANIEFKLSKNITIHQNFKSVYTDPYGRDSYSSTCYYVNVTVGYVRVFEVSVDYNAADITLDKLDSYGYVKDKIDKLIEISNNFHKQTEARVKLQGSVDICDSKLKSIELEADELGFLGIKEECKDTSQVKEAVDKHEEKYHKKGSSDNDNRGKDKYIKKYLYQTLEPGCGSIRLAKGELNYNPSKLEAIFNILFLDRKIKSMEITYK